jgi:hypothetical protein
LLLIVSFFVGQGVGLIDSVKSAASVVQEFKEDFIEAIEHMNAFDRGVSKRRHEERVHRCRPGDSEAVGDVEPELRNVGTISP